MGVGIGNNILLLQPAMVPSAESISTTELAALSVTAAKLAADAVETAKILDKNVTNAKLEDGGAADGITGDKLQFQAAGQTIGAVPILFQINQAAGANADTDITITQKIKVVNFWIQQTGAGVVSSTCQLKSTSAAISDALDTSGADNVVVRAASIDDANATIASGGILRITGASGATQPALTAYVLAVPVA
jgi:hypothetical protein